MRNIIIAASITIFFTCTTLNAKEKIEGAFNLKLGSTFTESQSTGKSSLTDGTPMLRFSPDKPFRSFSSYYVIVTPKTQKIHSIWGVGSFENKEKCEKEQALVTAILQEKYGDTGDKGLIPSYYNINKIDQGDRAIYTKCDGYSDVTLSIRYIDSDLRNQAENERIQLESQKLDSSGL